ncbi:MAG TPA: site-2 protease family protein [Anaerolineae bacterium]|nr:site-2 protease family protein [Anaerolineae bacterium]
MGRSFPIAKVKGIEIRVHWTFALVLIWAALDWGVRQGLGLAGALYGVAFISLLFLFVTLHELGHSLVARRHGAKVRDITLLPIGGVARLDGEMAHPRQELWMAVAGPAVNVALAAILGAIALPLLGWRALGGLDLLWSRLNTLGWERLLVDLLAANVGLALFNLLPAFPMDGGRVLRALLASRMGDLDATRIAARVGQGLAVVLGLVGLFGGGLNLVLVAAFIIAGAEQEWRGAQLKTALQEMPAAAALAHGGISLSPHHPLRRAIDLTLRSGQRDFAVFDHDLLVGVLTREGVAEGFQRYGPNVLVGQVMRTDFPVARSSDTLLDLQHKMQASGSSAISVVEGRRFLGLVTLEDIRNAFRPRPAQRWRPGRA